jgi:hypothetical protein
MRSARLALDICLLRKISRAASSNFDQDRPVEIIWPQPQTGLALEAIMPCDLKLKKAISDFLSSANVMHD